MRERVFPAWDSRVIQQRIAKLYTQNMVFGAQLSIEVFGGRVIHSLEILIDENFAQYGQNE
jgi:hypothetical protein